MIKKKISNQKLCSPMALGVRVEKSERKERIFFHKFLILNIKPFSRCEEF